MISNAKYKMTGNNGVVRPASNQCIVMSLKYLDNSEFDNPPNGGTYDTTQSYVVIKREGKRYKYFVRLAEKLEDNTLNGIEMIEESKLEEDDVKDEVLSKISDVNVDLTALNKGYFTSASSKCKCGSVIGSYFRVK